MAKLRSSYVCQSCDYSSPKWMGKCPDCAEWNSMVETVVSTNSTQQTQNSKQVQNIKPRALNSIKISNKSHTPTNISELDRALGGGIVPGQVILIAGEPGIGKSTILLQLAQKLGKTLYVSGEESVNQVAIRARRLGIAKSTIQILEETNIDIIIASATLNTVIIDSIQTMFTADLRGMAGSVGQIRECAHRLVRFAKSTNTAVFIVGHITKQGTVAGPAALMHIVDTVLWFEGDRDLTLRMIRARKNRFGPTDEVGIFKMEQKGLLPVTSADELFVSKRRRLVAGSAVTTVLEGTRPILVEVESLTVSSRLAFPKRVAQGVDVKKVEMTLAVLARQANLPVQDRDVYVNVAAGIKLKDPGADFALAMSLASGFLGKPIPRKTIYLGELSLLGDIRAATQQDKRIKEAKRLGYTNVISSKNIKYLSEAIKAIRK